MKNISEEYNKNYKKILFIPIILLVLSLSYLAFFYIQTGDLINKDVSLTGGTVISLFTDKPLGEIEQTISSIQDHQIRALTDNTGKQIQAIVTVPESETDNAIKLLEDFLGERLNSDNSSIETVSSSLGQNFYKQLVVAVLIAFFWMSAVVFLIFAKGKKIKTLAVILNLLLGILLGSFLTGSFFMLKLIVSVVIMVYLLYLYIKNSIPSFAVILSAFSDIVLTLALVNFLGIKISTAGIVAFLMLIGYSVDTDILLTTRVLRRKNSVNQEIWSAFKTGITMTLTSIIAVATTLIVVWNFQSVLNQVFIILLIGLGFDMLSTWLANATIIKWYVEGR